jgi:hypothetical protein
MHTLIFALFNFFAGLHCCADLEGDPSGCRAITSLSECDAVEVDLAWCPLEGLCAPLKPLSESVRCCPGDERVVAPAGCEWPLGEATMILPGDSAPSTFWGCDGPLFPVKCAEWTAEGVNSFSCVGDP